MARIWHGLVAWQGDTEALTAGDTRQGASLSIGSRLMPKIGPSVCRRPHRFWRAIDGRRPGRLSCAPPSVAEVRFDDAGHRCYGWRERI